MSYMYSVPLRNINLGYVPTVFKMSCKITLCVEYTVFQTRALHTRLLALGLVRCARFGNNRRSRGRREQKEYPICC